MEEIDSYGDNIKSINIKEVKKMLLEHFIFLKDENKKAKFYSKFNIDDENNFIINMWENIINYIYEEIFHCISLTISDLKKAVTINKKSPENFDIIINYLIYNKKYITTEDLNNEKFYIANFPYLYPKTSYLKGIMNYIYPKINFCKSDNGNNDNQIEEEETPTRNDLNISYISQNIPENSVLLNYKIFKNHCNAILITLKNILSEEEEEIITKSSFELIVKQKYLKTSPDNGKFKLYYGLEHEDEVIFYLYQTKQIITFQIPEDKNFVFIKVAANKDDKETEDDKKIARMLLNEYKNEFKIIEKNEWQK